MGKKDVAPFDYREPTGRTNITALKARTIRAAGLYISENEPKHNSDFLEFDNGILSPHIGSSTEAYAAGRQARSLPQ